MTRQEKSFASASRMARGFWRLHGRSPLTGRIISGNIGHAVGSVAVIGPMKSETMAAPFSSSPARCNADSGQSLTSSAELPGALTGDAADNSAPADGHAPFPSVNFVNRKS